jgi:hypothetical protein
MQRVLSFCLINLCLWSIPLYGQWEKQEKVEKRALPYVVELSCEAGPIFTSFDSDLRLQNSPGIDTKLSLHLWANNYLAINYRFLFAEIDQTNEDVDVHTLTLGIRHEWYLMKPEGDIKNFGIAVGIWGGIQRYTGTVPDDTGSLFSVDLAGRLYISEGLGIGLGVVYDRVLTVANQPDESEKTMQNFTLGLSLKWSF